MNNFRIALAQIDSSVGDINGNRDRIIEYIEKAYRTEADIVVFPEMAITGYPPEDLVLRTAFVEQNIKALQEIASATKGIAAVIGFIERDDHIYNSAAFIYEGKIFGTYRKIFLPNYGVFDEKRYFRSGWESSVFEFGNITLGINICEDIWYPDGPASMQAVGGAGIILNLNASPYHLGKWKLRERMLSTRAADNAVFVIYVNAVGGQDELVFEGGSSVFGPGGEKIARGKFFEEDLLVVDIDPELPFRTRLHDLRIRERVNLYRDNHSVPRYKIPAAVRLKEKELDIQPRFFERMSSEEEVYQALVLGVKDYVAKNGFRQVVIGVSGGIDSSLVAAIAVDALGADNVKGLFMPSRYSSVESGEDSFQLAKNLGIELIEIPIDSLFQHYLDTFAPVFGNLPEDTTEQNIQARIRGNLLMAYSNKFSSLVLTTGNKSELAMGYATLYGDMAGGFAVIKDIPKTMVYNLASYRNSKGEVIPERIFTKAPSAELKENQKDSDNLPPYEILDPILKMFIEEDMDLKEITAAGFEESTVRKVARTVQQSEYKRRQAPPGIKITPRAFGRDRRIPITNRFAE